jgi:NAD-dependent SIR2 family protein deacetylase
LAASAASTDSMPATTVRQIEAAAEIMRRGRTAVLTGAGISTDSGIPDYRGEGAPKRTPMTFQQFRADAAFRRRYWAGSHVGWRMFDSAEPNDGHRTLARLEEDGHVNGIVTQNVDGLHLKAGSRRVVDLHGSMHRVVCLVCGQTFARSSIAERIAADNPWLEQPESVVMNPDGDAEIARADEFVVPDCTVCGGMLKPDIVYFGELIPTEKFEEAAGIVHTADALLIAGSSLVVNSGIRLLEQALRRRLPVIIVNRGVTKGDSRATVKIDAGASETLARMAPLLAA